MKVNNVIIIEPSKIIFEGLVHILSRMEFNFSFRQATGLAEAERLICSRPESLVILNPGMIQFNQKEHLSIRSNWPQVRWVACIYQLFDQQLMSAFDGIINISDEPSVITETMKKVMNAEVEKNTEIGEAQLSEREIDVLKLLAKGHSNKEVADSLNISVNTAITHRKNISQKTGIKTMAGLTIYAVVNKYISLDNAG